MNLTPFPYIETLQKKLTKDTYLLLVSVTGSLSAVIQGFIVSQSQLLLLDSSFLTLMNNYDSSFISQFMTLFYLGELLGASASFIFSDMFGRNTSLKYLALMSAAMLLWCSITSSSANLLSARFFLGCTLGAALSISTVYVTEVATTENRGYSTGYLYLNIIIGSLLATVSYYLLQHYEFGWRIALYLPVLVLLYQFVQLACLPESPRWLLAKKTPGDCLMAMRQLRRRNDVSKEFNDIYRGLTSDARLGDSFNDLLLVHSGSIRMRMGMCILIQIMQQMTGVQIITIFSFDVLQEMGVHSIMVGLFLSALAGLMGSMFLLQNIDRMGRRFLLISGCVSMGIAWSGAALCTYWGGLEHGKAELYFSSYLLRFLFGSFLCVFAFSFAFSLGPISWILSSEVFPFRARAKGSSIIVSVHFLCAIVGSILLSRLLQSGVSVMTLLVGFAVMNFANCILVYLLVPETRAVQYEDMEELFFLDSQTTRCGCCPDPFSGGWLGFRRLADMKQLRHIANMKNNSGGASGLGLHSSGAKSHISGMSTATGDTLSSTISTYYSSSQQRNDSHFSLEGEKQQLFEPSSLHKYSTDLRENKFNYYQDIDETLTPSFNFDLKL